MRVPEGIRILPGMTATVTATFRRAAVLGERPPAFADLIDEFEFQRRANICLVQSLTEEATRRIGTASDNMVSARALVYMMAGHVKHHSRIFAEHYLA